MTRVRNTYREVGSDGLCSGERKILDLWDAGYSTERIVEAGFPRKYVKDTVALYCSIDEQASFVSNAVLASRQLAQAVNAAGGHR